MKMAKKVVTVQPFYTIFLPKAINIHPQTNRSVYPSENKNSKNNSLIPHDALDGEQDEE